MSGANEMLKKAHELWREGRELESVNELKKVIKEYEKADDKYRLIEVLNEYGGALRVTGNYKEALGAFKRAENLCADLNITGENYALVLANIANVYREMKEFSQSRDLFEAAKKIFDDLGIENYAYMGILNNYSLLLQENKLYEEAKKLQLKSVNFFKLDKKYRIPLAISYNNLYEISKNKNEYEEAKRYLALNADIIINDLGKEHPLYATLLNNLADMQVKEEDYKTALILYKEALNIIENKYGKESGAYKVIEKNILFVNEKISAKEVSFAYKSGNLDENSKLKERVFFDKKSVMDFSEELAQKIAKYVKEKYPDLYERLCLGLAGKGSECYLYEDELSKDHDCEVRCMIFLTNKDYESYYIKLANDLKLHIKEKFEIWRIGDFYKFYTSFENGPKEFCEFRKVEDYHLSTATNGRVFLDNLGAFSSIRKRLLEHYPKELRLKFIALSLNKMAQAGQYNFKRLIKRRDKVGANFALNEFIENYIFFVHLINKKYMPFYKWSFKSCVELEELGSFSKDIIPRLIEADAEEKSDLIDRICKEVVAYLNKNGLSSLKVDFLTYQAEEVLQLINDAYIKSIDAWTR